MVMLPVKFRLVQIISQKPDISNRELYAIVKNEYPYDRHVTQPGIDQYLMALKMVGIIELSSAEIIASGELVQYYRIAETGIRKLKYIDRSDTVAANSFSS